MQEKVMNTAERFKYWRKRTFWSIWITYAGFYLCRVNMSVAIPGIMAEYGISKTAMGAVLTALFFVYAIGQFINGQFGDKYNSRYYITIGIVASAILNIVFGFTNGFLLGMMLIWGLNGFFQSMGWAPSVKTIANWFPQEQRGKVSGAMGTSYQIGNAVSWALAGFVVGLLGWRWAFWVPAIIFIGIGIHWFIRGRNAPEEVGLPTIEEEAAESITEDISLTLEVREDHHLGFRHTLKMTLFNPKVWTVAFGLFCLNIIRYGFMDWAPTYMFEIQKATISIAAFKSMMIPIAGSFGDIFAGWFSDRYFNSRRAPAAVIMLILLAITCWFYPQIPADKWILSLMALMFIGFMTYGPHVLMCGTMAMDFGTRKAAASAAGFIDCWGYIGASLTGVGSGWLIDHYGWQAAFDFWMVGALVTVLLMALLWNYKPEKRKYH